MQFLLESMPAFLWNSFSIWQFRDDGDLERIFLESEDHRSAICVGFAELIREDSGGRIAHYAKYADHRCFCRLFGRA
jgi:hypothetical protein